VKRSCPFPLSLFSRCLEHLSSVVQLSGGLSSQEGKKPLQYSEAGERGHLHTGLVLEL
jgi:hypothetical protein